MSLVPAGFQKNIPTSVVISTLEKVRAWVVTRPVDVREVELAVAAIRVIQLEYRAYRGKGARRTSKERAAAPRLRSMPRASVYCEKRLWGAVEEFSRGPSPQGALTGLPT